MEPKTQHKIEAIMGVPLSQEVVNCKPDAFYGLAIMTSLHREWAYYQGSFAFIYGIYFGQLSIIETIEENEEDDENSESSEDS